MLPRNYYHVVYIAVLSQTQWHKEVKNLWLKMIPLLQEMECIEKETREFLIGVMKSGGGDE